MNTFCIIVFEKINPNFAFHLGLISEYPVEDSIKTNNAFITTFLTNKSLSECRLELQQFKQSFFVVDISKNNEHDFVGYGQTSLDAINNSKITEDEIEYMLLEKYKNIGIDSLTIKEKEFLNKRFL